jgi:hypothetical protein
MTRGDYDGSGEGTSSTLDGLTFMSWDPRPGFGSTETCGLLYDMQEIHTAANSMVTVSTGLCPMVRIDGTRFE